MEKNENKQGIIKRQIMCKAARWLLKAEEKEEVHIAGHFNTVTGECG